MDQVKNKSFLPGNSVFLEKMIIPFSENPEKVIQRIWEIGDDRGWYFATSLWKIRGFLDRLFGGVGYRKGRKSADQLAAGDPVDFWRVVEADRSRGYLLLQAEMKLPGKVFLEWKVENDHLDQRVYFYPSGLWGKMYWYAVKPFHQLIFQGMGKAIAGN